MATNYTFNLPSSADDHITHLKKNFSPIVLAKILFAIPIPLHSS